MPPRVDLSKLIGWATYPSTTAPLNVIDMTKLTERQLFCLWMRGFAVGAEIDRRGLGRIG